MLDLGHKRKFSCFSGNFSMRCEEFYFYLSPNKRFFPMAIHILERVRKKVISLFVKILVHFLMTREIITELPNHLILQHYKDKTGTDPVNRGFKARRPHRRPTPCRVERSTHSAGTSKGGRQASIVRQSLQLFVC